MKVVGIIPGNEHTDKVRNIYHTLKEWGIAIPQEIQDYINKHGSVGPNEAREVHLTNVMEWDNVAQKGVDIAIGKNMLPIGVTHIRVYREKYW
jgi:hypothetical protein